MLVDIIISVRNFLVDFAIVGVEPTVHGRLAVVDPTFLLNLASMFRLPIAASLPSSSFRPHEHAPLPLPLTFSTQLQA